MMIKIIILSLLCEALWENVRMLYENNKFNVNRLGALVVSVIVAIATHIDIFHVLDFEMPWILASFLTGILISRGANVLHDLLTKIQEISKGG